MVGSGSVFFALDPQRGARHYRRLRSGVLNDRGRRCTLEEAADVRSVKMTLLGRVAERCGFTVEAMRDGWRKSRGPEEKSSSKNRMADPRMACAQPRDRRFRDSPVRERILSRDALRRYLRDDRAAARRAVVGDFLGAAHYPRWRRYQSQPAARSSDVAQLHAGRIGADAG